jgi:hypothetical protein
VRPPLLQAFPFPSSLGEVTLHPPSRQHIYFQFYEGLPLTPSSALRVPRPFCYLSFFVVVYYSVWFFSLFSLGVGQSVQGAMLIWPRVVCGSTASHLAHLVVCFSGAGRNWRLVAWELSWFLHLTWSGDAMHGLGVWRSQSFASSGWFFLQSVSPESLQDFTLGSTLSTSSL